MSRDMCQHGFDLREQFCPDCASPADIRAKLVATESDNERLRELVKDVEWNGDTGKRGWSGCVWCEAAYDHAGGANLAKHDEDCPAFTPDGKVR